MKAVLAGAQICMRNRDAAHKLSRSAPHQMPAKTPGDVVISSTRHELIHLVELPHLSVQVLLACHGHALDDRAPDKGTGALVRLVLGGQPVSVPEDNAFQRARAVATNLHDSDDQTNLCIVCDVILADWYNAGRDIFDIRQFRSELQSHYKSAGKTVPAHIADPHKLVPTLRLLQRRSHLVKPTGMSNVEWKFVREP